METGIGKKTYRKCAALLLIVVLLGGCMGTGDSYADATDSGIVQMVEEAQRQEMLPDEVERAPLELLVDEYYGDDMARARREIGLYPDNMDALDQAQKGYPWYESLNAADKLLYLEIYQIMVSQTRAKIWLSGFDYPSLVEIASLVMTDHPELNMGNLGNDVFVYDDVDGVRHWSLALPFPDETDELYVYPVPDKAVQPALRQRLGLTGDNMDALYAKHADRMFFQYLSAEQQASYVEMIQTMEHKTEEALLLTSDLFYHVDIAMYAIRHDYPLYCYEYAIHYAVDDEAGREYYWLVRHDGKTPEEAQAEEDAAYAACVNLVSQMPEGLDEYGRVKWLYDWLILNTTYTLSMDATENEILHADTLAQTILERKPICGGYSTTMMMLCSLAGVECWNVSGFTKEDRDGYHGWNIVMIDGEWYEMDACWGDASWRDETTGIFHDFGVVDYTWFLFTTEDAERHGRIFEQSWTPTGTGRNTWFVREGANFSFFDEAGVRDCVLEQLTKGDAIPGVLLRFETDDAYEEAVRYLIEEWNIGILWSEAGLDVMPIICNQVPTMRTIQIFRNIY